MGQTLRHCCLLIAALAVLWGVAGNCFADSLLMDNGDRLSGRVTRVEKGKIGLNTSYAGELSVDLSKVRSLESDQPMTLDMGKTRHIYGRLSIDRGQLQLYPEDGTGPVAVSADDSSVILPGRVSGREWKLSGHIDVGGSDSRGNTVASRTRLDSEAVAEREKFRLIGGITVNQATDHNQQTESNVLAYAKYDRFITLKQYGYGNLTVEHDKFKDIKVRNTIGGGRGYDALHSAESNLSIEGGLSYVYTDFYSTSDDNYPAARLALRFDRYLIPSRLQVFHQSEVFIGLSGLKKSFAHSKTGLRMPLRDKLVASLEYDVDWDGNPAPGSVTTDRILIFSLGYHW